MSNHIISCATGYTPEELAPFVVTARRFCPEAMIHLIRYHGDAPIEGTFRYTIPRMECPVVERFAHLSKLASDIARNYGDDSVVIHCDARDVVFQYNPFEEVGGMPMWTTSETKVVGADQANYNWLRRLIRTHELGTALSFATIQCAGVFGGHAVQVADHCKAIDLLTRNARWFGADQAAHILLADIADIPLTFHGQVAWHAVLGGCDGEEWKTAPILHQYDRHPKMVEYVAELVKSCQSVMTPE